MTTGTWPTLDGTDPGASSAWLRGVTKRGKPPRDHHARMLRVIKMMAIGITLLVSIGWAFVGAAVLIW